MQERNIVDIFEWLKRIKKEENFKLALMSREDRIAYIVEQMEKFEGQFPNMIEYIEEPTNMQ